MATPWEAAEKGKGRPAKTEDKEAELGLQAAAAIELAGEWLVKAEVEVNVSLEASVALGVEGAWGDGVGVAEGPGGGTKPEKMEEAGAAVVQWVEVTGAGGAERVRITVGFGVDG